MDKLSWQATTAMAHQNGELLIIMPTQAVALE